MRLGAGALETVAGAVPADEGRGLSELSGGAGAAVQGRVPEVGLRPGDDGAVAEVARLDVVGGAERADRQARAARALARAGLAVLRQFGAEERARADLVAPPLVEVVGARAGLAESRARAGRAPGRAARADAGRVVEPGRALR